jgi:hypothetical protein
MSRGRHIFGYGPWRNGPTGWRRETADRAWRRYLSDGAETLFQNYQFDGSGSHGGLLFGSGAPDAVGPSQRLRPGEGRTLYRSIRRHTICTGCLTTASRWGRRSWLPLAGRMRIYRMGRSLLCGCSRWLPTSHNTVCEALWMATNGSSLSSRSDCWRPVQTTVKPTHLGGFEVGGNSAEAAAPLADDHT